MLKRLLLFCIIIQVGCKNTDPESVTDEPESPLSPEENCILPNPADCTGISIIWYVGETEAVFTKTKVINQIPESYTGKIKLIGSNCKNGSNVVDGLLRYVSVKNRKLHGISYEYSCDGSYSEHFYKEGLRQGTWLNYFKDGTVQSYVNYQNGLLHGKYEYFFESGLPFEKGCYSNGEYVGDRLEYYPNGNLKKMTKYVTSGFMLFVKNFREDGTLMSKMTFLPKTELVFYDVNGKEIPKPINVKDKIEINRD